MIKKTIKYKNYLGQEVTKDFYFHLSQVDMMELSFDGSFEKRIQEAVKAGDKLTIFREFKQLISLSVGVRSENGEEFSRPAEFRDSFMSSPAFDELVMELLQSPDQGVNFIRGLLPPKAQEALAKELEKPSAPDPFAEEPAWVRERRVPNKQEFAVANSTQKLLAFQLQVEKGMEPGQDLTGYNES